MYMHAVTRRMGAWTTAFRGLALRIRSGATPAQPSTAAASMRTVQLGNPNTANSQSTFSSIICVVTEPASMWITWSQ
jgi:hypothetical protein